MSSRLVIMRRRRLRSEARGKTNLPQIFLTVIGTALLGLVGLFVISLIALAFTAYSIYNSFAQDLPSPQAISQQTSQQFKTTKIYDRTGTVVLYELIDPQGGARTNVPLARVPRELINATVALEDRTFWTNEGVDYLGWGRAVLNMMQGGQLQGASTLTQQLVKKVLIPERETIARTRVELKIKEVILAREISARYSKQQILEWYLNTVYYGNFSYGVEAAAEAYFGKHVWDLSLSECATLAAIPQYPALNPIDNPDDAKRRRDIVLDQMFNQGYITEKQAQAAKTEKIAVVRKKFDIKAPHFVFYVRKYLEDKYGPDAINKGGWKVYTSLDYSLQQAAEEIARNQVVKLTQERRNVTNASVVVIRPNTGEIVALVGSVDYFNKDIDGQVNIAAASRQPGSSFKVFSYLTAFQQNYSPATVVYDVRTAFEDPPNPPYVPENYDRKYHGPVRLRVALGSSFNIPAVKVLNMVGVRNTLDMAHRMGITTLNREHYGLALTLGGGEVKLLDMTYAYAVLANGGTMAGQAVPPAESKPGFRKLDPVSVLKIVDADGKTLEEYIKPELNPIVTPQLAYMLTDVLADNNARAPAFGINSALKLSRPAAVKTGTTSAWRDNWTLGYTPDYAVGVWVGNSDNSEMEHISGITGAAPIWHDVMERIHQNVPVHPFVEPPGLVRLDVCAASGLLPTKECPQVVKELFSKGQEPKEKDNLWQAFRIFVPNGKLATAAHPPDQVTTVVFPVYPSEARDWAKENNIPQPPTEFDTTYAASAAGGDVAILSPAPFSYVREGANIVGNAKIPDLREWRVNVGAGLDPTKWLTIGSGNAPVDNGTLATWTGATSGLYTIQLTAIDGSGTPHTATAQVTVDPEPPKVEIINPWDDKQYLLEEDEWVSIDAQALDNLSMGKVNFFLDDSVIGASNVSPFTYKWNIKMTDELSATLGALITLTTATPTPTPKPKAGTPTPTPLPTTIDYTIAKTDEEGKTITETVTITVTLSRKGDRASVNFPNGFGAIRDAGGYTETHTVKVKAYDAAGNSTESKAVRFLVSHKVKRQPSVELDVAWARSLALFLPDWLERVMWLRGDGWHIL